MNEYDEYAVEQAIQLREQLGDSAELIVVSIGPARVGETIKKALAMGCDRGVHVQDPDVATKDPWQIASAIVTYAKDQGFDFIFTGMQSQDRGSAQVGVIVAEQLGYACATTVVDFSYADGIITAKRELEGGIKGCVKLKIPALVTCQLGLNVPRYPTLPNIIKAKKKDVLTIPADSLFKGEAMVHTISFHPMVRKGNGIVLEGEVEVVAGQLLGILKEKSAVQR